MPWSWSPCALTKALERAPLPEALDRDRGCDRVGAERRSADRDDVEVADQVVHQLADQRGALGRERRLLAVQEVGRALAGSGARRSPRFIERSLRTSIIRARLAVSGMANLRIGRHRSTGARLHCPAWGSFRGEGRDGGDAGPFRTGRALTLSLPGPHAGSPPRRSGSRGRGDAIGASWRFALGVGAYLRVVNWFGVMRGDSFNYVDTALALLARGGDVRRRSPRRARARDPTDGRPAADADLRAARR